MCECMYVFAFEVILLLFAVFTCYFGCIEFVGAYVNNSIVTVSESQAG